MTSHKILRTGIFILAFLVGLLRESIAQGHDSSRVSGEIHPR
jgi:hypothetical protein